MPILFNGNNLNPETLTKEFRENTGDKYVKAIIDAVKDEEGLLMWDIMNEPSIFIVNRLNSRLRLLSHGWRMGCRFHF
jgi:hypothetical protein